MKRNSVFLILLGLFLFVVESVLAHGGGTLQIVNAPIADVYQASVWSAPVTIRARDDIHITVGIGTIEDGAPVLDAAVFVEIYDFETEELVASAEALTENSINRLFYEADLAGLPQGDYDVVVTVAGNEGSGDVAFEMNIRPFLNIPLMIGAALLVVLFLGAGLFIFRRQQPESEDLRTPKRRNRKAIG